MLWKRSTKATWYSVCVKMAWLHSILSSLTGNNEIRPTQVTKMKVLWVLPVGLSSEIVYMDNPREKNHNFSHSDKFLSLKSTVGSKMLVKSRKLTLPPFAICNTILTYRPRSFCLIRSQLVSAGPSFLSTSLVCFFAFQGWRRRCWWKRRHSVEAW